MTDTSIQTNPSLQDCGLKSAQVNALRKLGVYGVLDLLRLFPKEHLDVIPTRIAELEADTTVTLLATLDLYQVTMPRNKLTLQTWYLSDGSQHQDHIKAVVFSGSSLHQTVGWQQGRHSEFPKGSRLLVTGTVKRDRFGKQITKPQMRVVSVDLELTEQLEIRPVYSDRTPLTGTQISDLVRTVLEAMQSQPFADNLTDALREQYGLMGYRDALYGIHQPTDRGQLERAIKRLVFGEFYDLECRLIRKRQQLTQPNQTLTTQPNLQPFLQQLPFDLTGAQKRVLHEISLDFQIGTATMRRLVQGDVGSGKTAVAAGAIVMAVQQGDQAAVMVPTTALCAQLYRKLYEWLDPLGFSIQRLHGNATTQARRQLLESLADGSLSVVIGTQSLLRTDVEFKRLGLVVIDEEHRFGVEQREALQVKGRAVHRLSLTATPIPRTLALTLHGDQDVSVLDEMPPGRTPITTRVYDGSKASQVEAAYSLLRSQVQRGFQAFVVFPLIEANPGLDLANSITAFNELTCKAGGRLSDFTVKVLHGKLKEREKATVMQSFVDGETQVLLATTVIEVGIDVPKATVILIHNGERFGLAQLHQLRGRVGRGKDRSFCLVLNEARSESSKARLLCLEQSQNGFWLAEQDLKLRGQGDILGTRQSGLLPFRLANLLLHADLLEQARAAAWQTAHC